MKSFKLMSAKTNSLFGRISILFASTLMVKYINVEAVRHDINITDKVVNRILFIMFSFCNEKILLNNLVHIFLIMP